MNSNVKLMEVKGVKTPNLSEPKGNKFQKVMNEIFHKVERKRAIKNNSIKEIKRLNDKLTNYKNQALMAEDEFEEIETRNKCKEIQEELEHIEDYSGLDINEFARKLINNPDIQKLKDESEKEYFDIVEIAKEYQKELDRQYNQTTKELNKFLAGYKSDSNYRQANTKYNRYKNSN